MGTDHAGISTQMLVERQLNAQGVTQSGARTRRVRRESVGMERRIRRTHLRTDAPHGFVARLEPRALHDGRRILPNAVREVFVRLYDEGLIYRGRRLVNWDPELKTAISDLEVENTEEQGSLWHFRYPLCDGARTADGLDYVVVATTRPETMLGDTAVAVHPDDERYKALIGARVRLPLADREIPIIADTLCRSDVRQRLREDHAGARLQRLRGRRAPRPADDQHLHRRCAPQRRRSSRVSRPRSHRSRASASSPISTAAGLVDKIEPHKLMVPRGDRSDAVIEPLLTDQWFVSIAPLAKPAIEAVERGDIEFVPKQYENLYFAWMRDIRDWCISRQQWWGHRIPAWYDANGGDLRRPRRSRSAHANTNSPPTSR